MRMRTLLRQGDSYFLEPLQEQVTGWDVRPGTFRVAQPYDAAGVPLQLSPTSADLQEPPPSLSPRQHKRQRLSKHSANDTKDAEDTFDPQQELVKWIKAEFLALLDHDAAQSFIRKMQSSCFYGTCVDAPANDKAILDLVKLQPTLRMLKSGFLSAFDSGHDQDEPILFEEILLEQGLQQLDLSDIYETWVKNPYPHPATVKFLIDGNPHYLIPPRSEFVVSDLDRIGGLKSIAQQKGGFDIIVMDPPWRNASVDRMAHYGTLDLYDLFKIPILDLLRPKQGKDANSDQRLDGIVAVWITNRAKIKKVVVEKLFPAWGLEFVGHWYWLKVTTRGEPVLSLGNTHRRPYEGILIGRQRQQVEDNGAFATSSPSPSTVSRKLVVSVPSQHSRKPSLNALLEEAYFRNDRAKVTGSFSGEDTPVGVEDQLTQKTPLNRLELFARNLEDGVFSWGNEPIRHQYCGRGSEDLQFVQDGYLVPSRHYTSCP